MKPFTFKIKENIILKKTVYDSSACGAFNTHFCVLNLDNWLSECWEHTGDNNPNGSPFEWHCYKEPWIPLTKRELKVLLLSISNSKIWEDDVKEKIRKKLIELGKVDIYDFSNVENNKRMYVR